MFAHKKQSKNTKCTPPRPLQSKFYLRWRQLYKSWIRFCMPVSLHWNATRATNRRHQLNETQCNLRRLRFISAISPAVSLSVSQSVTWSVNQSVNQAVCPGLGYQSVYCYDDVAMWIFNRIHTRCLHLMHFLYTQDAMQAHKKNWMIWFIGTDFIGKCNL